MRRAHPAPMTPGTRRAAGLGPAAPASPPARPATLHIQRAREARDIASLVGRPFAVLFGALAVLLGVFHGVLHPPTGAAPPPTGRIAAPERLFLALSLAPPLTDADALGRGLAASVRGVTQWVPVLDDTGLEDDDDATLSSFSLAGSGYNVSREGNRPWCFGSLAVVAAGAAPPPALVTAAMALDVPEAAPQEGQAAMSCKFWVWLPPEGSQDAGYDAHLSWSPHWAPPPGVFVAWLEASRDPRPSGEAADERGVSARAAALRRCWTWLLPRGDDGAPAFAAAAREAETAVSAAAGGSGSVAWSEGPGKRGQSALSPPSPSVHDDQAPAQAVVVEFGASFAGRQGSQGRLVRAVPPSWLHAPSFATPVPGLGGFLPTLWGGEAALVRVVLDLVGGSGDDGSGSGSEGPRSLSLAVDHHFAHHPPAHALQPWPGVRTGSHWPRCVVALAARRAADPAGLPSLDACLPTADGAGAHWLSTAASRQASRDLLSLRVPHALLRRSVVVAADPALYASLVDPGQRWGWRWHGRSDPVAAALDEDKPPQGGVPHAMWPRLAGCAVGVVHRGDAAATLATAASLRRLAPPLPITVLDASSGGDVAAAQSRAAESAPTLTDLAALTAAAVAEADDPAPSPVLGSPLFPSINVLRAARGAHTDDREAFLALVHAARGHAGARSRGHVLLLDAGAEVDSLQALPTLLGLLADRGGGEGTSGAPEVLGPAPGTVHVPRAELFGSGRGELKSAQVEASLESDGHHAADGGEEPQSGEEEAGEEDEEEEHEEEHEEVGGDEEEGSEERSIIDTKREGSEEGGEEEGEEHVGQEGEGERTRAPVEAPGSTDVPASVAHGPASHPLAARHDEGELAEQPAPPADGDDGSGGDGWQRPRSGSASAQAWLLPPFPAVRRSFGVPGTDEESSFDVWASDTAAATPHPLAPYASAIIAAPPGPNGTMPERDSVSVPASVALEAAHNSLSLSPFLPLEPVATEPASGVTCFSSDVLGTRWLLGDVSALRALLTGTSRSSSEPRDGSDGDGSSAAAAAAAAHPEHGGPEDGWRSQRLSLPVLAPGSDTDFAHALSLLASVDKPKPPTSSGSGSDSVGTGSDLTTPPSDATADAAALHAGQETPSESSAQRDAAETLGLWHDFGLGAALFARQRRAALAWDADASPIRVAWCAAPDTAFSIRAPVHTSSSPSPCLASSSMLAAAPAPAHALATRNATVVQVRLPGSRATAREAPIGACTAGRKGGTAADACRALAWELAPTRGAAVAEVLGCRALPVAVALAGTAAPRLSGKKSSSWATQPALQATAVHAAWLHALRAAHVQQVTMGAILLSRGPEACLAAMRAAGEERPPQDPRPASRHLLAAPRRMRGASSGGGSSDLLAEATEALRQAFQEVEGADPRPMPAQCLALAPAPLLLVTMNSHDRVWTFAATLLSLLNSVPQAWWSRLRVLVADDHSDDAGTPMKHALLGDLQRRGLVWRVVHPHAQVGFVAARAVLCEQFLEDRSFSHWAHFDDDMLVGRGALSRAVDEYERFVAPRGGGLLALWLNYWSKLREAPASGPLRTSPYVGAPAFIVDRRTVERLGGNPYARFLASPEAEGDGVEEGSNRFFWRALHDAGLFLWTNAQAPYPLQHVANDRSLIHGTHPDWEALYATYREGPRRGEPVEVPPFDFARVRAAAARGEAGMRDLVLAMNSEAHVKLPLEQWSS